MNIDSVLLWVWITKCIERQQYTSTVQSFATNSTDCLFSCMSLFRPTLIMSYQNFWLRLCGLIT